MRHCWYGRKSLPPLFIMFPKFEKVQLVVKTEFFFFSEIHVYFLDIAVPDLYGL